jgi:hypothetical protein
MKTSSRFVYDWKHPGLQRQAIGALTYGKGSIPSFQRLETPVIYFYADQKQVVDVSVAFPQGLITEWYPQARNIGPSIPQLPRAWTDRTLPLTLNPKPSQLVRVMVGRAEVLTPELKNRLSEALVRAEHGDSEARAQAVAELKNLGRFAPPALELATAGAGPKVNQAAWALLQTALPTAN